MDGQVIIGTKLDTKSFEKQIKEVEYQLEQLDYELSHAKELKLDTRTIKEYELKAEKLTNQLASLRKKQEDLNTTNLSGISSQLNNIGNSISGVIKKVTKWGLAIFGIRSAYMFVRQAMSTLSQYNEQLGTDVEYIRFALATTLQPIIERIIQLVYTLLQYIGYIAKAWFGVNLFAKASTKAFQSGSKAVKDTNKEAQKLQKTLTGFDEMNILQEDGSVKSGGGGGGAELPTPNLDLSNLKDIKIPSWMQWIINNKDAVIAGLLGIAGALTALGMGLTPLMSLGIGIAIGGIVYAIQGLLKYLKDPSWKNFGQIIQGIGIAIIGLAVAIGSLPVAIAGVAVFVTGIVVANWGKIKGLLDSAVNWLTEKMNFLQSKYGFFAGMIVKGVRDQVQNIRESLNTIFVSARSILDNIIKFFKNVFTGNWKAAWNNLVNIASSVLNILVTKMTFTIKTIKNILVSVFGVVGDVIGGIIRGVINGVLRMIENKINTAINMFNGVLSVVNKLPGVKIGRISTVRLPRLAKGGIVNNPGPGVMMGSYVAGEKGPEAVLPLTDDTLQRLANMMPITVNVTNSMNGRVISREIQRVQNNSNFAMNR